MQWKGTEQTLLAKTRAFLPNDAYEIADDVRTGDVVYTVYAGCNTTNDCFVILHAHPSGYVRACQVFGDLLYTEAIDPTSRSVYFLLTWTPATDHRDRNRVLFYRQNGAWWTMGNREFLVRANGAVPWCTLEEHELPPIS